ncbi:MAG: hypothetical protein ACI8XV_002206 [Arenicella sp.]|jgi:hypothetical protein
MLRNEKVLLLYIALTASFAVVNVATAGDWDITQQATIEKLTLTQTGTTSSNQAINAVVLDTATDSISAGNQTVVLTGNQTTLTQEGSSSNSVQALNYASAKDIVDLTQTVSGVQTLDMVINAGTDNVQALNYASASGNILDLTQTVTGDDVNMVSNVRGNIQAINHAEANSFSGDINQTTNLQTLSHHNIAVGRGNPKACNNPGNNPNCIKEVRVNSITGNVNSATINQTIFATAVTKNGPGAIVLNYVGN